MTIERGSQVMKALTQLRIVEHTRRGNRHWVISGAIAMGNDEGSLPQMCSKGNH